MKSFRLILGLLALFGLLSPAMAEALTGRVVGVSDGDTLTLLVEDGARKTPVKIRLAEIDTPESKQPWGTRAKQALSDLAYNKQARAEVDTTDRYGRKVAKIYVGSTWVNAELVRGGHAWVYRQYSNSRELLRLEDEARAAKRGLWSLPESERTPPWEWRHGAKSGVSSSSGLDGVAHVPALDRATPASGSFRCDGKTTCRQMSSCAEAQFYLRQCGLSKLDKDGDGVPCESLCR